MRVVTVTGTPRARGRQHGEELRPEIAGCMDRWLGMIGGRDAALAFAARGWFRDAVVRWTPDLADEVAGIADGAALDPALVWAYQLMDEEWWHRGGLGDRCSSIAVHAPGRPPIVAQNMDLPAVYDGGQVLLDVDGALVLSAAGLIALTGLNRDGVAVCCNSLTPPLPVATDGLPVAFVLRGALARHTATDAEAFLREVRHATGQNYVVGDPDGIRDLECSVDRKDRYRPSEKCLFHTNHPLTGGWKGEIPGSTTFARFDVLAASVAGPVSGDEVERTLAVPPVSVARTGDTASMTIGAVVMELVAGAPVLRVAPGPPETTPFETHRLVN